MPQPKVAVLYQHGPPPLLGGIPKPLKPGGYADSGADIACALQRRGVSVTTPEDRPRAEVELDWVYADTGEGIAAAIADGAGILWANTVLHAGHPLEGLEGQDLRVVGQLPSTVQDYDDKWTTHELLREAGCLVVPAVEITMDTLTDHELQFPLVLKPIRGRGSQGVIRVEDADQLRAAAESLEVSTYGSRWILEEYLPGEELTMTVMPPGEYRIGGELSGFAGPWCLPPVRRQGHVDGVAPYSGVQAVIRNSALLPESARARPEVLSLLADCERASSLLGARAPLRIDSRYSEAGALEIFDVNLKPNMTGPGRPGREGQDSLSCLAARGIGWSYEDLVLAMLGCAWEIGGR